MNDFLQDKAFLLKLNRYKHRQYYSKIDLLSFVDEKIISTLEGKITSGSITVSASSPTRRTGTLTTIFDDTTRNLADINNLFSINKKISIEIGIKNPWSNTDEYSKYGDILWFKQGVFFITQASSTIAANGNSVTINFIDKMGLLNGVCGGTFPASTTLSETVTIDENEDEIVSYPLIRDIIIEMVHHFGNESFSRIIVEDIEEVGREVVKWNGDTPIWFLDNNGTPKGTFEITAEDKGSGWTRYLKGEIIGYMETDLTYPGELTMSAGETVTAALDKIVSALGNYEYFYDVDGVFHFRKKRNFQGTGDTPLNLYLDDDDTFLNLYSPIYNANSYLDEFLDNELIISMNYSPNYSNIKNDFVCWGSGGTSSDSTNTNSNSTWVRYHLAIDERPTDIPKPTDAEKAWRGNDYSLCHKTIYAIKQITNGEKTNVILRYEENPTYDNQTEYAEIVAPILDDLPDIAPYPEGYFNWREELYRRALLAYGNSTQGTYYDEELRAEWRKLYDPLNETFKADWNLHINDSSKPWLGYNPQLLYSPDDVNYWIDFIDTNSEISKYSVNQIGRRTKAEVDSEAATVFAKEVPDVVFIKNTAAESASELRNIASKISYYVSIGQTYSLMNPDQWSYLKTTTSNGSCYENAREALYDGIIYKSTVSLTAIPIFYFDVNNIVLLNQVDLGIKGNYVINQITFNLAANSMSLSLQEAITIS